MGDIQYVKDRRVVIRKEDRVDYILSGVCDYYGITPEQLRARSRGAVKSPRKRLAIKLLYDIANINYREIAEAMGHSSVHSVYDLYVGVSEDLSGSSYGNNELKQEYVKLLKHLKL